MDLDVADHRHHACVSGGQEFAITDALGVRVSPDYLMLSDMESIEIAVAQFEWRWDLDKEQYYWEFACQLCWSVARSSAVRTWPLS